MPKLKFTHSQRLEIARAYLAGESPTTIGRRHGTSGAHVIMIAQRYEEASCRVIAPKREPPPSPVVQERAIIPEQIGGGCSRHAGYLRLM